MDSDGVGDDGIEGSVMLGGDGDKVSGIEEPVILDRGDGDEVDQLNGSAIAVIAGNVSNDKDKSIADGEEDSDKVGVNGKDEVEIVVGTGGDGVSGGKTNESAITNEVGDGGSATNGSLIVAGVDNDEIGMRGSKEFVIASGLDRDEVGVVGRNGSAIIVGAVDDEIRLGGKH